MEEMTTVRRKIVVDRDRCTGCQLCKIECSFLHEGGFQPSAARVRLQAREGGRSPLPLLCLHCESQECAFVCPTGARKKEVETGQVIFEEDKCVHCKMCLLACPHAGPIDVQEEERLLFCDFCGGSQLVSMLVRKGRFPLKISGRYRKCCLKRMICFPRDLVPAKDAPQNGRFGSLRRSSAPTRWLGFHLAVWLGLLASGPVPARRSLSSLPFCRIRRP